MKKLLLCLLVLFMICGCSAKTEPEVIPEDTQDDTVVDDGIEAISSDDFVSVFEENAENDVAIDEIAAKLCEVNADLNLVSMNVEPGYLNGFSAEITKFTNGIVVSPMIGSIPFIIYVFETDDANGLMDELFDNMDMRWNICTEATDWYMESMGSVVFFMMFVSE